jgi:hypothetical protein
MCLQKRTLTSNIYEIGGGRFRGVIGGVPNVPSNLSGDLVPLDNRLVIKSHPVVKYLVEQGPFEIGFHNKNTNRYLSAIRLHTGETLIKTAENDVQCTPVIENSRTIKWLYPNGSWIKEVATEKKIKETMFVKQGQQIKFRYKLNGLNVKKNGNYFDIYRGEKKAFSIERPYLMTGENGEFDQYINIDYQKDGDDWIAVYPIAPKDCYIDPTIIFGEGAGMTGGDHKDTTIISNAPNNSYGSRSRGWLRNNGGIDNLIIGRFSLVGHIPAEATINSAVLTYMLETLSGAQAVGVRRLLTDWGITPTNEGVDNAPAAANEACFNQAFTGTSNWSGGAFAVANDCDVEENTFNIGAADPLGTAYNVNIPTMVTNWYNNDATNYGFALAPQTTPGAVVNQLHSQEAGVAANRPYLTVDYTVPVITSMLKRKYSDTLEE